MNEKFTLKACLFLGVILFATGCQNQEPKTVLNSEVALNNASNGIEKSETPKQRSKAFQDYWYSGTAEISSFRLEQARYGEMRDGQAVLVFVTEDFREQTQVKADYQKPSDISILKLNSTKTFNTGIYPYSIMQSTFFPVSNNGHALKVTASIQEWCGQVYTQLNNKDQFEIQSYSYFESEGDQRLELKKTALENEIWTQLRVDPKSLPTGEFEMVPSLEYIRLKHIELKSYRVVAERSEDQFNVFYPELDRRLTISFNPEFPYDILAWEETFKDGFGASSKYLTTKATRLHSIKSAYWSKNSNSDEVLRDTLQLR